MRWGRYNIEIVQNRIGLPNPLYSKISCDPWYSRLFVVKRGKANRESPHLAVLPLDSFRMSELKMPKSRGDVYETSIHLTEKWRKPKIYLAEEFQRFASLEKEATLVDLLDVMEIWNPNILKENLDYICRNFQDIQRRLSKSHSIWGDYFMQLRDSLRAQSYQPHQDS